MAESESSPPDVEAVPPVEKPQDPNLVTWAASDPAHPQNWPRGAKWKYTIAVSLFTFISPVSSSMVAPALASLGSDLHMSSSIEVELALSIFILAYAIGPLFFGPASEVYGRLRLFQISNAWYMVWNLACGFAKTPAQFFVFRFLAGLGGSAPLALGGGALSDIWSAEERGKAMGIYALAPVLGPVAGPVAGGFIAETTTWRWVFWSSSAFAVLIQLFGLIWLRESYAPVLLKQRRDRLAKETGNANLYIEEKEGLNAKLLGSLVRPLRMISTQPIVACIALYIGYLFGTTYLLLATFPAVWTELYGQSKGIGGLNYISMAVGSFIGIAINFVAIDRIYRGLKRRNGGVGVPEFRLPTMMVGSTIITVGLFWYGWSVQARLHWIMPDIGVAIFSMGVISCLQGMQTYIVDTYTRFAASAMAACAILRSLGGFAFPLFAPYMYQRLGYGWGTSVLAFASVGIGLPALIAFWTFGAKLRATSKYAAG